MGDERGLNGPRFSLPRPTLAVLINQAYYCNLTRRRF